MKIRILLAALAILLVVGNAAAGVRAPADDTYLYDWDSASKTWVQYGKVKTGGNTHTATLCVGQSCMSDVYCSACHTMAMDMDRYARDEAVRHDEVHYPNAEIQVAGSDRVMLDVLAVFREGERLMIEEVGGRRFELPRGARLVGGRDGRPAFVVYPGSRPPEPVR
jgi:hypothetical protein